MRGGVAFDRGSDAPPSGAGQTGRMRDDNQKGGGLRILASLRRPPTGNAEEERPDDVPTDRTRGQLHLRGDVMIIRAPRPDRGFTILDNTVLRDARLSYRARGLLAEILSRPDDWRTDATTLARNAREGREAIRSAMRELEQFGYLVRKKIQDDKGHWRTDTYVFDSPQPVAADDHTDDGFSGVGSPGAGELGAIRSTETKDQEEDELSCPALRAGEKTTKFRDWRSEDLALFVRVVDSDVISSDGSGRWQAGTWPVEGWYRAFRDAGKRWPGLYVEMLGDGVDDYLAGLGLDRSS